MTFPALQNLGPESLRVLGAAHCPSSGLGAQRVVGQMLRAFNHALVEGAGAEIALWREVVALTDSALTRLRDADPTTGNLLTLSPSRTDSPVAQRLCSLTVRRHTAPLLARAFAVALERHSGVSAALVSGIFTIERMREGKAGASADWSALLDLNFSQSSIRAQLANLNERSPCRDFLGAAVEILETGLSGPSGGVVRSSDTVADRKNNAASSQKRERERERRSLRCTVEARLLEATYAPFTQKLGLTNRDCPGIEQMAPVCTAITATLNSERPIDLAIGVLGTLVVLSGFEPEHALALPINTRSSVFVDINRGVITYNFLAVISSKALAGTEEPEFFPAFAPLPRTCANVLRRVHQANAATSVSELLEPLYGSAGDDFFGFLDRFRSFIREKGDPVWRMYGGRLANGYQQCILELTGSDMAAAALSLGFAATAPASMNYYSPLYSYLWGVAAATFSAIGFDEPVDVPADLQRFGTAFVLPADESRSGWQSLTAAINAARARVHAPGERQETVYAATECLQLLCAAFVIRVAHRAKRLAELTPAALLIDPEFGVVFDKAETIGAATEVRRGSGQGEEGVSTDAVIEVDRRVQPRLIPYDPATKALLSCAVECRETLLQLGLPFESRDPLFATWCGSPGIGAAAVSTAQIGAIIARHFKGAPANFGRAQWVTHLDECGVRGWLTRALTGHSRDLTRVWDTYFCVPPVRMVGELRRAMVFVGQQIFGDQEPTTHESSWCLADVPLNVQAQPQSDRVNPMPNLWTVLPPITPTTQAGWLLARQVRTALMSPPDHLSVSTTALLFLIFVELIPDPEAAVRAALDAPNHTWTLAGRRFVLWSRSHFVHPVAFPVHASTFLLLEHAGQKQVTRGRLLREAIAFLQVTNPAFAWPDSDEEAWNAACNAAAGFRRLHLPPSMVAVSSTIVPAPCASRTSLERLAGVPISNPVPPQRPPRKKVGRGDRSPDLLLITKVIGKYADTKERDGERRRRAILARAAILDFDGAWSPFGRFIADWLLEELERTRDNVEGRYQVSSLGTYFNALTASKAASGLGDPYAWEGEDWLGYLQITDSETLSPKEREDRKKEKYKHDRALNSRLQPAAAALLRSLARRSIRVDSTVWKLVREKDQEAAPRDSASSTLILSCDLRTARELANQSLQGTSDERLETTLIDLRAEFSDAVPLRSGDLGSIDWHWKAGSRLLNIRRRGYNVHKTEAAIRIVPLATEAISRIERLQVQLAECLLSTPELLLRLNGTGDDGARDTELQLLWGEALKAATGDMRARPHSVRAATVCKIAWPGWEEVVARLVRGEVTPKELSHWCDGLLADWLRIAKAAAAAGHADLRAVLGSYLSAWPLVHAAMAHALLCELGPRASLFTKLGLNADSAERARARARKTGESFSPWMWIEVQVRERGRSMAAPDKHRHVTKTPAPRTTGARESSGTGLEQELAELLYLQLRIQGTTSARAMTISRLPLAVTSALDQLMPCEGFDIDPTARQNARAAPRGKKGDMETTCSNDGGRIRKWVRALADEDLEFLHRALTRDKTVPVRTYDSMRTWSRVVGPMPDDFRLQVRRGTRYPYETGEPKPAKLDTVADDRLGGVPEVAIRPNGQENRVRQARLRATLATAVLARLLQRRTK